MSNKKFCDFCDNEIDTTDSASVYYKYVVEYIIGGEVANNFHQGDICEKCYKKGVIIKEET